MESGDLRLWTGVFDAAEQAVLLRASLAKLDAAASSSAARAARKAYRKRLKAGEAAEDGGFLHESAYAFERSHLDGVIDGYRETTLREWPDDDELIPLLKRLYAFVDGEATPEDADPHRVPSRLLAHLLHLSSSGRIDPHVDNVDASVSRSLCYRADRAGGPNRGRLARLDSRDAHASRR